MSDFSVNKYTIKSDVIINGRLFIKGDEIYIQSYDPVRGRQQLVFDDKKANIGSITSTFYWDLKNELELLDKTKL